MKSSGSNPIQTKNEKKRKEKKRNEKTKEVKRTRLDHQAPHDSGSNPTQTKNEKKRKPKQKTKDVKRARLDPVQPSQPSEMKSSGSNPIQTKNEKKRKPQQKTKDVKRARFETTPWRRSKKNEDGDADEAPPWRRCKDSGALQPSAHNAAANNPVHPSQPSAAARRPKVHLTSGMVNEWPPEDRQTMFGPKRCCLEQRRLREMCLDANVSEIDLTSGEKFPWKQMFLCIPFAKAQRIIGAGITKFTFRVLPDKHYFEVTCVDGTKWNAMEHDALPKRIADDNEPYTWCEFLDYYGDECAKMWRKAKPADETEAVFIRSCIHQQLNPETLACPITRSSANNPQLSQAVSKRQPHTSMDVPDWYYLQPQTPPDVEDVPVIPAGAAAYTHMSKAETPCIVMVGLSGPSGVGKSTLARGLAEWFDSPMKAIDVDDFRKRQWQIPKTQDGSIDWETPEGIDFAKLLGYLDDTQNTILAGRNMKTFKKPREHPPEAIIIVVEGFVLFHNKAMCERLHVHLWVEADCDTCLQRRLRRKSHNGRKPGPDFATYYRDTVWAQYQSYRQEQLSNVPAAVHLDGSTPKKELLQRAVNACLEHISKRIPKRDLPPS